MVGFWAGTVLGAFVVLIALALLVDVQWAQSPIVWRSILEYLKAFFNLSVGWAWPATVLILAWIFRSELRKLILRIREVGPTGLSIAPEDQTILRPSDIPPSDDRTETTGSATSPYSQLRPALAEKVKDVKKWIEELDPSQRDLQITVELAKNNLGRFFENTYGQIFGSQLHLLQKLADSHVFTMAEVDKVFRVEALERHKDAYKDFSFDRWFNFLIARGLTSRSGDIVRITDLGRELLTYIQHMEYSMQRPY